jgi:hypothetical protein
MFETSEEESSFIDPSDSEKWYISLSNAQEFIEALNFQEFLTFEEIEAILIKNNTGSMKFDLVLNEVADLIIINKKIHTC